jgi:hypothetical protein
VRGASPRERPCRRAISEFFFRQADAVINAEQAFYSVSERAGAAILPRPSALGAPSARGGCADVVRSSPVIRDLSRYAATMTLNLSTNSPEHCSRHMFARPDQDDKWSCHCRRKSFVPLDFLTAVLPINPGIIVTAPQAYLAVAHTSDQSNRRTARARRN